MVFHQDFLILPDKSITALRFVESMRYPDGEDLLVSKLKDDLEIEIVMCSGRNYTISVRAQFPDGSRQINSNGISAARDAILGKWKHVITGKSQ